MSKNKALLSVLLLAVVLRLVGINHGFPFIFHPDEPTVVRSALGIRFNPNPEHFDWPHLYIYVNYFVYMVFAKIRGIVDFPALKSIVPLVWDDTLIFYLITRILTALLGALTVIPVYLTGKFLFNQRVGIFSALALALFPFHVWHSHYSLTDVPMVFFLAWGLYFCARIFKETKIGNYLWAGLFVGFSASTKYNGGLSALVVPLAYLARILSVKKEKFLKEKLLTRKSFLALFLSGVFAFLGFAAGTPFALFDYETFSRTDGPKGAFWQFKNVGSVDFVAHVGDFAGDLVTKLPDDIGYTFMVGFFFVLGLALWRLAKSERSKTSSLFLVLLPALFLIWYIAGFEKSRSHYYMISYPYVAVVVGYFASEILTRLKLKSVWLGLFFAIPLLLSARGSYIFASEDSRVELYNWMAEEKISETVVFQDSTFIDILDKLEVNSEKGLEKTELFGRGWVLLTEDDSAFRGTLSEEVGFTKKAAFGSRSARGPEIEVYYFEK
jgi:4-amino-4-deoxy-L-arabinose transferase-like glycosyltransferase